MNENRIAFVIGTRAELIKVAPVMLKLQEKNVPYYFIHTGQHDIKKMCLRFGINLPDKNLFSSPEKSSKFNTRIVKAILWNFFLVAEIRKSLKNIKGLKFVIYHGDTMTTASAAIASSRILNPFKKYKSVHLEAGLRSGNIFEPFPEEISRIISDSLSDVLLAVSDKSVKNLEKYFSAKKIINVGNTILDSVEIGRKIYEKNKKKLNLPKKFAVISIHRHENIKNRKRLEKIIRILNSLQIKSYFPLYDNTKKQLERFGLYEDLKKNKNIIIVPAVDYVDFIHLLEKCSLIICDGGSLQEESLILMKPCIVLRKHTERPEGLKSNFQFLSKLDVKKTTEKIKEYLSPNFRIKEFKNPYGEERVSDKIINKLK